jgi:hypothetical protein
MMTFEGKTMGDLVRKIFAAEGWVRMSGESWIAKVKTKYDIAMDVKRNRFIATSKI